MKNLTELLEHEVKDLYSAEKQLMDAIPEMIKAATNEKLKKGFTKHLKETERHLERIQEICKEMDINPGSTKCNAMAGLIEECQGLMNEKSNPEVMDAGLIACARRVEHYEIAGYDTAYRYAKTLKLKSVRKTLKKTLKEEEKTEKKLKKLAKKKIIKKAKA
ncbi:MAG: ferritin-like domain-containing protein [Christiangramia sp.]